MNTSSMLDADDRNIAQNDASTVKLGDFVYAKIAGRIRSGEYPVDARLPTENELASMLSVSRPVVREALARLRNDGWVVSRRGSGTYVQKTTKSVDKGMPALTSIADMRRCFDYRISLEGEAAYHAALGKPEDRRELTDAMAQLEADLRGDAMEAHDDFAFHSAIAVATGNRFFVQTMAILKPSIVTAMGITPSFISLQSRERLAFLHDEHVAIYDAIMANNADGARLAIRTHLINATKRVFEGVDN